MMPDLKERPTLKDLQIYMQKMCDERGWNDITYSERFLLFTEEVGELAKSMRKAKGLFGEPAKQKRFELEEEFADVLSYLLDLANRFDVDLETAFRQKEKVNEERLWNKTKTA